MGQNTTPPAPEMDQIEKDRHRLSVLEQAAANPAYTPEQQTGLASLARAQRTAMEGRARRLKAKQG